MITLSGQTAINYAESVTSFTVSHEVTSGTKILLVRFPWWGNGAQMTGLSMTYNGVALTEKATITRGFSAYYAGSKIWCLQNPSVGTYNLSANWTGAVNIRGTIVNVNGSADSPFGSTGTAQGLSGTASVNVSSAAGQLVVDLTVNQQNPWTVGSGQTQEYHAGGYPQFGTSYENGAGTTTMSWTCSSADWVIAALALKPAPESMFSVFF